MSAKNPEYDFRWCPGCGDFGVRRALEMALAERIARTGEPIENTVVVTGIGCSGNLVHLLEGPQPYGIHGIHGRTLPIAMGVKMARPELNVVAVAGDGDFLSIGMEHIAPQAARNLDVTAIVLDNSVYGLTKGQSSPTLGLGEVSTSTPYGKPEEGIRPLELYLALGVSFVASGFSGRPKDLASLIGQAMDHPGFAIVHVHSPCTTYHNTYDLLKGDKAKGIPPLVYDIPPDHNPTDWEGAMRLARSPGVPLGVLYRQEGRPTLQQRMEELHQRVPARSAAELLDLFQV